MTSPLATRSAASPLLPLPDFMNVFAEFRQPSWQPWKLQLARITPDVREFYAIVGRGAGKSRIVALIACWFATREYRRVPGERIYIGVFAPDRKQAGVTFRYVKGLLQSVPALAALITSDSKSSVDLSNGVTVEVITATTAAPRGRAYALAIVEEAAFLPPDTHANPDVQLLQGVRPGLARVPGSLLAVVSSPWGCSGVLYTAFKEHHGKPDGDVVLVHAPTTELNPTFDQRAIDAAYREDPASAATEYGAQFRTDVQAFLPIEVIDRVIASGRAELPRVVGVEYRAFLDFAGGSGGDSATLAIAHSEPRDDAFIEVLDAIREVRPPFSPEDVCREFADVIVRYGVTEAVSDRWGGMFPIERMGKLGVTVTPSAKPKSDLYRELTPLINSNRCELLDVPRLRTQLSRLERRTSRGGRDSIDHGPGGHDDVANAVAGVLVLGGRRSYYDAARGQWVQDFGFTF